jgi:hypothetical protein
MIRISWRIAVVDGPLNIWEPFDAASNLTRGQFKAMEERFEFAIGRAIGYNSKFKDRQVELIMAWIIDPTVKISENRY